jgi:glutaredoxin-like protein
VIPLKDQDVLRERFQSELTGRVRIDYFSQRRSALYIPGRQECVYCEDVKTLLEELAHLSDKISLTVHELSEAREEAARLGVDKVPGIVIRGQANRPVRFFGIPSGNEFPGFVETLIDASRGAVGLSPETLKQLRKVKSQVHVQVFVTPTCPYCPALARTAQELALASPKARVDVVEASEFPALTQRYGIRGVPTTVIDDSIIQVGAMDEAGLVQLLLRAVEGKPLRAGGAPGAQSSLTSPQAGRSPASSLIIPR